MELGSELTLQDNVTVEIVYLDTGLVETKTYHNKVMRVARNAARDWLLGNTVPGISHIAFGTGARVVADTNTALENEVHRAAMTQKIAGDMKSTYRYYLGADKGNGYSLTRMGLFNSQNKMFAEAAIDPVAKTSLIQVGVTWDVIVGAV